MDDEADPASQFFPDGNVDLYGALGVDVSATDDEIKKAYRRCALKYHPDKQRIDAGKEAKEAKMIADEAAAKFQQIGFAYAVLSSKSRRARFDATGQTSESMFGADGDGDMDWNAYFRELWTGEVNANTLDEFKKTYQGSAEERADILDGYRATKGHFVEMVDHVPYMSLRVDRARIEEIVERAIKAHEVKRSKHWDLTRKDEHLLARAISKEASEESEAMEMAREMGVYDALFGDEAAKAKSRAKGDVRARKRKADDKDGEGDLSALQSLIVKRNQNRGSQMDNLIAKLEAEARAPKSKSGSGRKKGRGAEKENHSQPSEEEFARIQSTLANSKRRKRQ